MANQPARMRSIDKLTALFPKVNTPHPDVVLKDHNLLVEDNYRLAESTKSYKTEPVEWMAAPPANPAITNRMINPCKWIFFTRLAFLFNLWWWKIIIKSSMLSLETIHI